MERRTFERALHEWDKWHESIVQSRQLLDYNPKWSKDECINWIEGQHGQERHYPEVREQALAELKRLELPPTLQTYWEDCFYSDFRTEGGTTKFNKITRRLSKYKSLPDLPCNWAMLWHEDEDIHDPWVRIEIKLHTRFATKELFDYAARYAYETVKGNLLSENVQPHPVCQYLKGGRPKIDEGIAKECAKLKDVKGWTYKEIGQHFDWNLQRDTYGNLNQCSTAKRYVKWGRELSQE
jgi:hypothetical protein